MTQSEYIFQKTVATYNPLGYINSDNPRILHIGCASSPEVPILKRHFGKNTQITGIDKSEESIACAQQEYPDQTFISEDARQILSTLPSNFDIILMVHSEIMHNYAFGQILKLTPLHLKKEGILFTTLYSQEELQSMETSCSFAGYNAIVSEQ